MEFFFTILTMFRNPQKGAKLYILVFPYKECIKISKLLELLKGHVFIDWPIMPLSHSQPACTLHDFARTGKKRTGAVCQQWHWTVATRLKIVLVL